VLVADYWLVRRRRLALQDLYLRQGAYAYSGGWNPAAVVATVAGCALAWGGLVVDALKPLWDYGWFIGFFAAAILYLLLMRGRHTAAAEVETRVERTA
jgi:NCS1 family nucleobase:cation symporter-1